MLEAPSCETFVPAPTVSADNAARCYDVDNEANEALGGDVRNVGKANARDLLLPEFDGNSNDCLADRLASSDASLP